MKFIWSLLTMLVLGKRTPPTLPSPPTIQTKPVRIKVTDDVVAVYWQEGGFELAFMHIDEFMSWLMKQPDDKPAIIFGRKSGDPSAVIVPVEYLQSLKSNLIVIANAYERSFNKEIVAKKKTAVPPPPKPQKPEPKPN